MYGRRWCRFGAAGSSVAAVGLSCVLAAAVFAAPAGAALPAGSVQFRTVDVPLSVAPSYDPPVFTQLSGVNDAGTVVGTWTGEAGDQNGFIQEAGGKTITFAGFNDDTAAAINDEGTVVGDVCSCGPGPFLFDGYVRSPDGSVKQVDDPLGVGETFPSGINDSGVIVGSYADASGNGHGFMDAGGKFTTIDYPGALATGVSAINNSGAIVGNYLGTDLLEHGFLYRNGKFTELDAHGAGTNPNGYCGLNYTGAGTAPTGISAGGTIVGTVCNDIGAPNSLYGWSLAQGQFASLNDPEAAQGTMQVGGISENGRQVAGSYLDANGLPHGFVASLTP